MTPISSAAVVMGLPARTSSTALLRNSAGKGRGLGETSQQAPEPQTIAGNQTMGHVEGLKQSFSNPSFTRSESRMSEFHKPVILFAEEATSFRGGLFRPSRTPLAPPMPFRGRRKPLSRYPPTPGHHCAGPRLWTSTSFLLTILRCPSNENA